MVAASLASSSCLSVAEEYIIHDQQTGLKLVEQRQPSLLGLAMQVYLRDPPDIQGNRMLNLLLDRTPKQIFVVILNLISFLGLVYFVLHECLGYHTYNNIFCENSTLFLFKHLIFTQSIAFGLQFTGV